MNKLVLIAGGSTLIYAILSLLMGVLPGIYLSQIPPGPGVEPLTPLQAEGRDIYASNGCSYCHTQQVRPLPMDKVFGRPSAPGDFAYQTPALLGSARTGPDLTNIGVRQPSEIWQYIHLYNPRAVVAESIMPSYPWLFNVVDEVPEGEMAVPLPKAYAPARGHVIPTGRAKALVAYLQSLKQPPLPGAVVTPTATSKPESVSGQEKTTQKVVEKNTDSMDGYDTTKGTALYTAHCAACHQPSGDGLPGAFPALKGNSVINDDDPTKHIHVILFGMQGEEVDGVMYVSPMPPFGTTLNDTEVANIINHERSSWGNHGALVATEQVAAERNKAK